MGSIWCGRRSRTDVGRLNPKGWYTVKKILMLVLLCGFLASTVGCGGEPTKAGGAPAPAKPAETKK
jgi:hypothetical protein